MKAIRLTHHEFAAFYGELCDVLTRYMLNIPEDDSLRHTCSEARKVALQVVDRMANEGYLEYR